MSFLGEIKRRKVFQVAAVYAVVAWLTLQVVDVVNEPLSLPDWFDTVVILLLAVGFPVTLVMSWAFNLTHDGVVWDQGKNLAGQSSGRRIEYVLIGLLVLAVGFIFVDNYVLEEAPDSEVVAEEPVETAPTLVVEEQRNLLPKSVAVLPFENLSPDPNNAYFAAGIHESTINQLAKIRDLIVIARTSVMRYEDDPPPIPEIAKALNVEMVMEGSARYANDRVLITVKLIDGQTGTHLWSDEYDRDLADVFAVQAEIAENIAVALEAELVPSERERIEEPYTDSPEAYVFYLRALDAGAFSFDISESYLDQAIKLDPNFAVALATKAYFVAQTFAMRLAATDVITQAAELEAAVRENAERALQLDPSLGLAHAALAELHLDYWREDEARAAFELAAELSPNDPMVLSQFAWFNSMTGENRDAKSLAQRAIDLSPGPEQIQVLGETYMFLGDLDTAIAIAQKAVKTSPADAGAYFNLAEKQAVRGNHEAALENLQIWEQLGYSTGPGERARGAQLYSQLGRKEDAERLFVQQQEMSASDAQNAVAFLAIEDYGESLRLLRAAAESQYPEPGDTLTILVKVNIWNDPILNQPDFVEVRRRLGFGE